MQWIHDTLYRNGRALPWTSLFRTKRRGMKNRECGHTTTRAKHTCNDPFPWAGNRTILQSHYSPSLDRTAPISSWQPFRVIPKPSWRHAQRGYYPPPSAGRSVQLPLFSKNTRKSIVSCVFGKIEVLCVQPIRIAPPIPVSESASVSVGRHAQLCLLFFTYHNSF